ncbi:MAG: hypothetical protein KBH07_05760 [Flavobacteriales bacterium]|nr:hypothetical protein [Flavobacteriales bacterium]MBP9080353.1 hypothetical protein [Flavobacteriales bacterium]
MQLPSLFFATLLLTAGAGCKGKQELPDALAPSATSPAAGHADGGQEPQAAVPAPEPGQDTTPLPKLGGDNVFFAMERTPCFGTCPAYKLIIRPDGSATYEGRRFAVREGSYTGQVDAATMNTLKAEIESIGFYALNDVYDQPVTDLPSLIMRLRTDGHDKQVLGRVGAPKAFKDLAIRVEELLAGVEWMPVEGDR